MKGTSMCLVLSRDEQGQDSPRWTNRRPNPLTAAHNDVPSRLEREAVTGYFGVVTRSTGPDAETVALAGAAAAGRPHRPWPFPVARQRAGNYAPSHAFYSRRDPRTHRSDGDIPASWCQAPPVDGSGPRMRRLL